MFIPLHVDGALNRNTPDFSVDFPELCPRCGKDFVPQVVHIMQSKKDDFYFIGIFRCSCCEELVFATIYKPSAAKIGTIKEFFPNKLTLDIPPIIENLYPEFYRIYKQSYIAELKGLDDICGMGFRKALESLVKEYAIARDYIDKENIEKESLSKTIKRLNNVPQIHDLAEKITWLGNDQTHIGYVKHPDYGIEHIKIFLKALCYFIAMEDIHSQANKITKK